MKHQHKQKVSFISTSLQFTSEEKYYVINVYKHKYNLFVDCDLDTKFPGFAFVMNQNNCQIQMR